MNVTPVTTSQPATSGKSMSELGQNDFFRLLTVQIQQQDPFDPVDNKEMLAQMAQFSSLAGIGDVNETLQAMSGKLDKLIDAGTPPNTANTPAAKEA
jgi:flagellar basal-body rod modification protein FlgD